MAKGNMLLGYSTGSVGDVTFARVKGQQTQRARNRNPNNPKTPAQMYQRAKLAAAVNFFKSASSRLFKFAFEDRGAHESDYNAFMRHNLTRTMPMPKGYNDRGYLPVTPFVLSAGSLSNFTTSSSSTDFEIGEITLETTLTADDIKNSTTVAKLTQILKRDNAWLRNGDIITAVTIMAFQDINVGDEFPGHPTDNDHGEYEVLLEQVVLSETEGEIVPTFFQQKVDGAQAGDYVTFRPATPSSMYCVGWAIVISRQTANGMMVSTSPVILAQKLNDVYDSWFVDPMSDEYKQYLETSWGATPLAVLQGGLV